MKNMLLICCLILVAPGCLAAREGIEKSLDISTSGLLVSQARMQIIAENIANVNTTSTSVGGPYKRKDLILKDAPDGVAIQEVVQDNSSGVRVYDPGHPDADKQGFVFYPNVNMTREMTDMAYTSKIYDANIAVYNMTKNMAQALINLGK
jgi:flagellar basal-body rod protein FlgC